MIIGSWLILRSNAIGWWLLLATTGLPVIVIFPIFATDLLKYGVCDWGMLVLMAVFIAIIVVLMLNNPSRWNRIYTSVSKRSGDTEV